MLNHLNLLLLFSHLSDLVRFSLLYLYGGTYLDTDVITIKPLPRVRSVALSLSLFLYFSLQYKYIL